jgi:hypothetical protein
MSLAVKASMGRQAAKKCVMQVVARDKIERSTLAFSGERSAIRTIFIAFKWFVTTLITSESKRAVPSCSFSQRNRLNAHIYE